MNTGMISVIALHRMEVRFTPGYEFHCSCGEPITDHPAHLAEKLTAAGYSKPRTIESFDGLEDYLHDLNYEHGQDHTAFIARGILYSVFCTDPDAEWILETGDPRESLEYQGDDKEATYTPMPLSHLRAAAPFTLLHDPEATR